MTRQASVFIVAVVSFIASGAAGAATITPTVFTDDDVANGNCTLREAIEASQDNVAVDLCAAGDPAPTVDTIVLGTGVYALAGSSPPSVGESVTIEGAGQAQTEVLANVPDRLLVVLPGAELTIEGITLGNVLVGTSADPAGCLDNRGTLTMTDSTVRGCRPFQHAGALRAGDGSTTTLTRVTLSDNEATSGGAIGGASATLHLIECTVEDNTATDGVGGAINASGQIILERTLVRRNHASALGGGIRANSAGTTVELIDSTVDRNTAGAGGGGLSINGGATATLVNTTVSYNQAATLGGGMQASSGGTILAENSTISGNRAGSGGGAVWSVDGAVTLTHATLAANQAPGNSAVGVDVNGSVTFVNTLLADGGCTTVDGTFTSGGGNLESPGDTCGLGDPSDQTGIADPALSGLVDLGGETLAQLPLPGSPARDAALAGDCPADDQRGQARPVDGGGGAECDVGSVEALLAETAPLFADGFEVGDTLAWSLTVP